MRTSEARYIGEVLAQLPDEAISPCLNIGSSTRRFRQVEQPHIDRYIFAELGKRKVEVVHADLKAAEGIDIVGDIYEPAVLASIKARRPSLIMCCNMFEHVEDRGKLASSLSEMLGTGGRLIVTVPHSYPIHYDPIDTYFRPTPEQLAGLFPAFELETSRIVADTSYSADLLARLGLGGTLLHVGKSVIKLPMVWRGKAAWVAHFHRYLWFWRPYSTSCVVLRKRSS